MAVPDPPRWPVGRLARAIELFLLHEAAEEEGTAVWVAGSDTIRVGAADVPWAPRCWSPAESGVRSYGETSDRDHRCVSGAARMESRDAACRREDCPRRLGASLCRRSSDEDDLADGPSALDDFMARPDSADQLSTDVVLSDMVLVGAVTGVALLVWVL